MAEELLPCPREPDGKMLAAGRDALEPYVGNLKQPIKDQWELARLVWAAMTEARPSSQPLMVEHCQKCAGKIEGWTCQSCGQDFSENPDGKLVFAHPVPEQSGWRFDMENAPNIGWFYGGQAGGLGLANCTKAFALSCNAYAWLDRTHFPAPPLPEQEAV